jgi:hypothetical protein
MKILYRFIESEIWTIYRYIGLHYTSRKYSRNNLNMLKYCQHGARHAYYRHHKHSKLKKAFFIVISSLKILKSKYMRLLSIGLENEMAFLLRVNKQFLNNGRKEI